MQEVRKLPQIEIFLALSHKQCLYRNIGKAGSQGEHSNKGDRWDTEIWLPL
jgi:hypothetical protein